MQYFKDRTEVLMITILVLKKINGERSHVYNWLNLFTYAYNARIKNTVPFLNGGK
jgi:hypothetical protein